MRGKHHTLSRYLLHYLTTTSRNSIQSDAKINMLITIIITLLFPNLRLVFWQIFGYDKKSS